MSDRMEFWSRHLVAIEMEGVTTKVYAEREGLSVAALYQWRRRLKAGGQPSSAMATGRGFVPVTVQARSDCAGCCSVRSGEGVRLKLTQLPSPEWLAALAAAVVRRVR